MNVKLTDKYTLTIKPDYWGVVLIGVTILVVLTLNKTLLNPQIHSL